MNYYNFYVETAYGEKSYKVALNEDQINRIVSAYLQGETHVNIKGSRTAIGDAEVFIIYSIQEDLLSGTQAEIERQINKTKRLTVNGKLSLTVFKQFGTNVTDDFTGGRGWGSNSANPITTSKRVSSNVKIFISHAVKDADIVRLFTEHILQIGLGLKPENIFNISIEDAGIKSGENFRARIESELKTSAAVIQIITQNYKYSEACLNEMGAAWILDIPVIPFIVDPITYSNVGFIHTPTQILRLNVKKDMLQFVAEYKGVLFDSNYNDTKLVRKIDEFITQAKLLNTQEIIREESTGHSYANPFYKINQHSTLYILVDEKYRELPDPYTETFYGYRRWNAANSIILNELDLKAKIGKPIDSVLSGKIWIVNGDPKQWLIYNSKRHHILNIETSEALVKSRNPHMSTSVVERSKLLELEQGDAVDWRGVHVP